MSKSKRSTIPAAAAAPAASGTDKPASANPFDSRSVRETVESIAIAFILAFLFRTFEAEPFVIPTGSMAPTLMGRHKDLQCAQCGYWYQTGASEENYDNPPGQQATLISGTCPMCGYEMAARSFGPGRIANHASFTGDRILVSKFERDVAEPKRWDVIVFKFPGNAKQNYIKRLVGLPGETLRVVQGDVLVKPNAAPDDDFRIARKPPHKIKAMLQLVHDTAHVPEALTAAGWPARWQEWSPAGGWGPVSWRADPGGTRFEISGENTTDAWLRYRHLVPRDEDWDAILAGGAPTGAAEGAWFDFFDRDGDGRLFPSDFNNGPLRAGMELLVARYDADSDGAVTRQEFIDALRPYGDLITDYYAYNDGGKIRRPPYDVYQDPRIDLSAPVSELRRLFGRNDSDRRHLRGHHWVGDLALECEVRVESETGELTLQLIEGGVPYRCRFDLATGRAVLTIDDGRLPFTNGAGESRERIELETGVRGPGTYHLRFSNIDDELQLWIDERPQFLNHEAAYTQNDMLQPVSTHEEPGDLAPAGLAAREARVEVRRLRVLRDVYYIAVDRHTRADADYEPGEVISTELDVLDLLASPEFLSGAELFQHMRRCDFELLADPADPARDQFFPMGDNSPQSKDGRLWDEAPGYVERELLTGKALLIYWPHSWNSPVPLTPNVGRMRPIR